MKSSVGTDSQQMKMKGRKARSGLCRWTSASDAGGGELVPTCVDRRCVLHGKAEVAPAPHRFSGSASYGVFA